MTQTHTLKVRRFDPTDPRLGRHVLHDSRSLAYQVSGVSDPTKLTSVRHRINIPVLNQGQLGSCTGNASANVLGSDAHWGAGSSVLSTTDANTDERYAVGVYSDATKSDPYTGTYPPTDTGSDGLSVAKVLKARGLISGYQHATSLNAALTAGAFRAVLLGTKWLDNMFEPDPHTGNLDVSGSVAGGHEYTFDEIDVENRRVWILNSWASDWGINGRAWMAWDDLGTLLDDDGDCTDLVPLSKPAPTPDPDPPFRPVVTVGLAKALDRIVLNDYCPDYLHAEWPQS